MVLKGRQNSLLASVVTLLTSLVVLASANADIFDCIKAAEHDMRNDEIILGNL